jgi:hypothetical protein
MSFRDCLKNLHLAGEVTKEEAEGLAKLYDDLIQHYGSVDAAKAELVARLMRQAEQQKRQKLLADDARDKLEKYVLAFKDARGQQDPGKALIALIEHNGLVQMPEGFSSVVGRANALQGLALAQLEEMLHAFKRTWVTGTTPNKARLQNVVREAAGESTGDVAAKQFATAWLELADMMRQRFNAAGGAIGKLDGWFLPQMHDRRALLGAGKEKWKADIAEGLDLSKMKHPLTGNPMTKADLDESLDYIWSNITADGWLAKEPSSRPKGLGSISNQRAEERFLHFKSADDWLKYQENYGGGADPFASMMGHVKGMAEDIAAMEVLGPNPRAMLTYLQQFVLKQAGLKTAGEDAIFPDKTTFGRSFNATGSAFATVNPDDYARDLVKLSDDMWNIYRGATDAAVNQRMADVFGTMRNLNVATKLGGAALSAVTDIGFQQMARSFAGLPVIKTYSDIVTSFATGNKRDAVRAGLILDTAINMMHTEARWAGGMQGPLWSRYLADRVIATSGLAAWTQSGRHAWGLSFMGQLASDAEKAFDQLPAAMQRTFGRYGLTAQDWDLLRAVARDKDLDILGARDVFETMQAAGDQTRLAERYLEMILQEGEYAVPQGTLQAKARAYGGLRRGVLMDEIWRSAAQFKMFGISVVLLQGQRIANEMAAKGTLKGAGYAAALLITTTLYGAMAMQLKDISKGKDPRPMDNPDFWGGALLQGGGLGIFGDFLAAEQNRFGGGLAETLAGPTASVVSSLIALGMPNVAEWIRGEETNMGRELVRVLGQNTPGGSNWYLRLAYERMVLDELQKMTDPDAYAAFRRRIRKQRKDFGNDFWWAPGEREPSGTPDFSAINREE